MTVILTADQILARIDPLILSGAAELAEARVERREEIWRWAIAARPLRLARATPVPADSAPFVLSLWKHFVCEDSST